MPSADSPPGQGIGDAQVEDDSEESIEAVENLLESYFMQIDTSYDRLVSIGRSPPSRTPDTAKMGSPAHGSCQCT